MNRTGIKRISVIVFSVMLACVLMIATIAQPVAAASAQKSDYVYKTDYTTTDKKPTYTATLNENNRLLSQLAGKKENKVLKKVKEDAVDWIKLSKSAINVLDPNNSETDLADLTDLGVDLITQVAGIWGCDGLAEFVFQNIEKHLSSGNEPLSEFQILTDDLKQQFDVVNDNLNEVKEDLAALSNQVTSSMSMILEGTQSQINNLESKQILREFMMSGDGGFSYLNYSNYLYGTQSKYTNAAEAYYPLWLEACAAENPSEEEIKKYLDFLFDALYSNIGAFSEYYFDDVIGADNKSIVMHYYDYLLNNPNLVPAGSTAEYEALMFALDLYTSYCYTYELMEMCFGYQNTYMFANGSGAYEYAPGKAPITKSIIEAEQRKAEETLAQAEEQMVRNLAYIFKLSDSYTVTDNAGNIYNISNCGSSFGNLAAGQTVYMNVLSDELCEIFFIKTDRFHFFVNGNETAGTKGIIDSNAITEEHFTVEVKYNNKTIYSIDFAKIDAINNSAEQAPILAFTGGSGTASDPYMISNAVQLGLIQNDLSAHYMLIADIPNAGTLSPIGTDEDPFTGTFDGNGHTIYNVRINSLPFDPNNSTLTPATGIFGVNHGTIKDLTLSGLTVSSKYSEDQIAPRSDSPYFYVGGIAGINRGQISNCTIADKSTITVNRRKELTEDRHMTVYVGGIAAENVGVIEYCSVDGLAINVDSYLYYNDNESKNSNTVHVGGIAATTYNTIQYCRVSENCSITAYAKSETSTKANEKPYVNVYTGGILGDSSGIEKLSNVYSACTITLCDATVWNDGTKWGQHRYAWDNVTLLSGPYYPAAPALSDSDTLNDHEKYKNNDRYNKKYDELTELYRQEIYGNKITYNEVMTLAEQAIKTELRDARDAALKAGLDTLGNKIVPSYDDAIFQMKQAQQKQYSIVLQENLCEITEQYLSNVFNKTIDADGPITNIRFVDENGTAATGSVVGHYGFQAYHTSTSEKTITVKVLFYVDDTLYIDDVTIVVKGKELAESRIEGFYSAPIERGISTGDCLDTIFKKGFRIVYVYSNGQIEDFWIQKQVDANGNVTYDNSNTVGINGLNTSAFGVTTISVSHHLATVNQYIRFDVTVEFKCNHQLERSEIVPATCKFLGYEIFACQIDGCKFTVERNYVTGDHSYEISEGREATCKDEGCSESVYCKECGKEFQRSDWIQKKPHNYVSGADAAYKVDGVHSANEYHYCTVSGHYELHQYTVSESKDENGTLVYIYTCATCSYKNPVPDYNIITEETKAQPTVVVTDGYVLQTGDQVVVYVQLLNNPGGFNGASFGIRYDDGLELLNLEEGTMVPQELKAKNPVYNGYNFTWADSAKATDDNGYLLKLTFRYIGDPDNPDEPQNIWVVYGMANGEEGGFNTVKYGYRPFVTQSGTVRVVNHLPGDVNNDKVVDIMDATYIAWAIVGKLDENNTPIQVQAQYADVNLDGKVNLEDVLAILQSLSGSYGTSLLNSQYALHFNLGGFECEEMDKAILVQFYKENGQRTTWSENINFDQYEELMRRLGYSFVGWYTRLDCTCETDNCDHFVKVSVAMTYDKNQVTQTLYARWEKNKIVFDMAGANGQPIEEIVYSPAEHANQKVTLSDKIPTWSYNIDFNISAVYAGTGKIYKDFLGWMDENGNIVPEIDLSEANLGTKTLTAVWSEYKWEVPDTTLEGYENITTWYVENNFKTPITVLSEEIVDKIVDGGCNVYHKARTPKTYTITYENTKGVANDDNSPTYNITTGATLKELEDTAAYEFLGWYDAEGHQIKKIEAGTTGNITLIAKWKSKIYAVTVNGIDTNDYTQNIMGYPIYASKANICTIYYIYGDDEHAQGFYTNDSLTEKLSAGWFTKQFSSNFTFGGLYNTDITSNGGQYASGDKAACVLTADFVLGTTPALSDNTHTGNVYIMIKGAPYKIVYHLNDSEGHIIEMPSTYYYNNNDILLSVGSPLPGYSLAGWYSNAACTKLASDNERYIVAMNAVNIGADGKVHLYAKWVPAKLTIQSLFQGDFSKYTPKIDANGKYEGLPLDVTYCAPDCYDTYIVVGWYAYNSEGTRISITNGSSAILNRDHDVYPQWVKISDTIGFVGRTEPISEGSSYTEHYNAGFDIDALKAAGYTKITVTVSFDAKVVYSCNQRVIAYSANSIAYSVNGNGELFGHDFDISKDNWQKGVTFTFTNDINFFDAGGKFSIRWECPDGNSRDEWQLGDVLVTFTFQK